MEGVEPSHERVRAAVVKPSRTAVDLEGIEPIDDRVRTGCLTFKLQIRFRAHVGRLGIEPSPGG